MRLSGSSFTAHDDNANMSGSSFDDINMSGWRVDNVISQG